MIDAEAASHRMFDALVAYGRQRGEGERGGSTEAECVDNELSPRLTDLAVLLHRIKGRLDDDSPDRFELAGYATRCEGLAATAAALIDQSEAGCVYWLEVTRSERGGRTRRVRLAASPVDVGPTLRETLFERGEQGKRPRGVVMTSATLATGGGGGGA